MGFRIVGGPESGKWMYGQPRSSKNVECCATVEPGQMDRGVNCKMPGVEEVFSAARVMKEEIVDVQHI